MPEISPRRSAADDLERALEHRGGVVSTPCHRELEPIGAAYRDLMGRHYPAMAVVVVAGLVEAEALVEIEATAVLPR